MPITPHANPAPHNTPSEHPSGQAVHRFGLNTQGRDFIIGDIHGYFQALRRSIRRIKFNRSCDRLFSVGDLVDRGPSSNDVIAWINQPWFHPIRGNHEQMAIECVMGCVDTGWYIRNGGAWFIDLPEARKREIAKLFSSLPLAIEVESPGGRVGIVHAEASCAWELFTDRIANMDGPVAISALWSRKRFQSKDATPVGGWLQSMWDTRQSIRSGASATRSTSTPVRESGAPRLLVLDPREIYPSRGGVPDVMPKKI